MLGTLSLCTRSCLCNCNFQQAFGLLFQNRVIRRHIVRDHCWESFIAARRRIKNV